MSKPLSTDYSTTPCDECNGPTYVLPGGSVWCPAEDPHPGGHFVIRMMFERTPAKQAAFDALHAHEKRVSRTSSSITSPAIKSRPTAKPKAADPFASGFDAFIGEDK